MAKARTTEEVVASVQKFTAGLVGSKSDPRDVFGAVARVCLLMRIFVFDPDVFVGNQDPLQEDLYKDLDLTSDDINLAALSGLLAGLI
jgi:hypothetical protein